MARGNVELQCTICNETVMVWKKFSQKWQVKSWQDEMLEDASEFVCEHCEKELHEKEVSRINEKYNPASLNGSEKQVAWAEDIRLKAIKMFANDEKIIKFICSLNDAVWFIDYRNNLETAVQEAYFNGKY